MKAILSAIRISPKKANLVAGTVRGKKVNEALALLKYMPKKGAAILYKVLHSAASNAKNNFKQSLDDLLVTKILVTKGPTYKRSLPVSRGRAHPIRKRTSHIVVEVGTQVGQTLVAPKTVDAKKIETKKPAAEKKATTNKPVKSTAKKSPETSEKKTIKKTTIEKK